MLKIVKKAF